MKTIYIIEATYPYEGSMIIGAFESKESAEKCRKREQGKLDRFDKACQKEDFDGPFPEYFGAYISASELKVKP